MRESCADVLRVRFRHKLITVRADMKLTQDEMAQLLSMSLRSYTELERGKSGCSATTLVLFLIRICPDPITFLNELREIMGLDDCRW